jgi:hypothetical protein
VLTERTAEGYCSTAEAMTRQPRTPLLIAAACAAFALLSAVPVLAQPAPPSPGASGVEQYRELVPGAGGPSAPGVGSSDRAPLPRAAQDALAQAPPDVASALEEIATSSEYGAPANGGSGQGGRGDVSTDAGLRSTLSAIGSASDARVLGVLFVVLGMTVAAVGLALSRKRGPQASA